MENLQGTLLKGYLLKERIGSGGFGAVYRARQSTIGREVAVKIILPDFANNPDFILRFEAEAHLVARLEHPHITPLHDFWRDPTGAYLVMRYLKGGSVRHSLQNGPYELHAASQLLDQITSGLDFAHRNEVIHHDIKPGNILLDEDGNAYLADFGIAKDLDHKTAVDTVIGSLDYISPEQARGEPVTPCTDIYSLGVFLYEIITGEHPFKNASTIERLYKHINDPLPEIMTLPDDVRDAVNAIIQKATAKDPAQRYPDVLGLAADFREGVGRGIIQQSASIVEQLTLREQEVLSLVAKGMNNREIADHLVVAMSTVKWHITQLYKKLGVRSRVQAIVRARELNLIVSGDTSDSLPVQNGSLSLISLPEPENPYKGLHAFQMTDARDFFGRDDLTKKLLSRMCDNAPYHRFLAIVGPSGSGKSSLVKAGLIPALWRGAIPGSDKWFVVDMIPGSHPLDKLETALIRVAANQSGNLREQLQRDERGLLRVADIILPGDKTELVIVVDQFEEVFTLVEQENDRQRFLDLLRVAVSDVRSRVRVVVTLRADYYDRPLHYPEFGELIRSQMETILPLTAKGLERAMRGPAERVGVVFEQGLVEQIVSAMNYQAGALPLLQYALTELFDRREGRLLTNEVYRQIGGAVGALANRADEIYRSLPEEAQELTHQMFLRMVTLGEGAEDTRRRVTQAELLSLTNNDDLMEEIIDQFTAYRLLSLDHDPETRQPTVEVAHEAILRDWDRLRQWLNESRDDIRQEQTLARAALEWKQHNQDVSYLLRGARLEQVETWQQTTALILTSLEQDYITKSLHQHEQEANAEIKRQEREARLERRSQNFLRGLVSVFAVATLVSAGFGMLALNRQQAATAALGNAKQSAAEFRSVALSFGAKDALDSGQPDVALALAREAISLDNPPFASKQMFFTVGSATWIKQRLLVSNTRIWDAVYHPDGKRVITTSWDGRAAVWDVETGEELQSIQREGIPLHVGIHPDGNLVAIGGQSGHLQLWNLETDEVIDLIEGKSNHFSPVFTRDGLWMLTTSHDGRINIWDMQTNRILRSFEAHDARIQSIQFNADESQIMTAAQNGQVKIWDLGTGELVQTLVFPGSVSRGIAAEDTWVWEAQFLPDGKHVLTVDGNGVIILWDWRSGEHIWLVEVDEGAQVHDLALSPDGNTFLAVIGDPYSQVQLIDVKTGNLIRSYRGHSLRINNVDLSPDGTHFITAALDGTAIIWTVNWEGTRMTTLVPAGRDLAWHPTRPLVAVIGGSTVNDGIVRLVNTATGAVEQEFAGQGNGIMALVFTPDGRYLLAGDNLSTEGYPIRVWDIETGEQVLALAEDVAGLNIAISADSRFVAVGSWEGARIAVWDISTGNLIHFLNNHRDWVTGLVFSPDGRYLYSAARDGALFQWNMQTGEVVRQFSQSTGVWEIDLNSDGTRLVSAMADHTAIIWDTSTGTPLLTLHGHTDALENAEFSPDDRTMMTSALDGRIILWDAHSGEILRFYVGALDNANPQDFRAHFSPDGQHIASGANNVLIVWDALPLDMSLENWFAENRYMPDFTCEQRMLYVIEPLCEMQE